MKNKINSFQFAALGLMLGNALFVAFGIVTILNKSKQDAWITMIIATFLSIIPILVIIYIINYKPDKDIFQKLDALFGKIFGKIVSFIIACYVLFMLFMVVWSTTYFALTQYLSKVPFLFLSLLFIFIAVYAVSKGIETIARANEIMLFMALFIIVVISLSLGKFINLEQLKPILTEGIKPIIGHSILALSYAFPPLLTLSAIPKDSLVDGQKYSKYLLIGFAISVFFIVIVTFYIVSINTIHLAEIFRYPEYYVQFKIDVAGIFEGVENFLTLHWMFNSVIMMIMCIFFLNRYIKDTFKLNEGKKLNIITLIVGIIVAYGSGKLFPNSEVGVEFMRKVYPVYISGSLFGLLIIISIFIFFNKLFNKSKKKKESEKILLLNYNN